MFLVSMMVYEGKELRLEDLFDLSHSLLLFIVRFCHNTTATSSGMPWWERPMGGLVLKTA